LGITRYNLSFGQTPEEYKIAQYRIYRHCLKKGHEPKLRDMTVEMMGVYWKCQVCGEIFYKTGETMKQFFLGKNEN
jgi:hypothetical protein